MIPDIFIGIFHTLLALIIKAVSQWGDVALDNNLTTSIVSFKGYISSLAVVFPYTILTMFGIIAFDLAFEAIWGAYKLIRWAYQKIPFVK